MRLTSEEIALLKTLAFEGVVLIGPSCPKRPLVEVLADQGLVRSAGSESEQRERRYVLSGRGLRLARSYPGQGRA